MPLLFSELTTVIGAGFIFAVVPGADCAVVFRNTLQSSRREGMFTALGVSAGYTMHSVFSLIGLGALICQSELFFNFVKLAGFLYLLYLGIDMFKSTPFFIAEDNLSIETKFSYLKALRSGLLVNLLNPKCFIFFPALFTQVIDRSTSLAVQFLYIFVLFSLSLAWFSLIPILATNKWDKASSFLTSSILAKMLGCILIALAIQLALLPF
ncbi:MAG: LysE family translocator [Candidatus Electrothrix sp. AR4]|nr:LysE family translocator [Candidatus Electrothrix sp. AR4]